MMIIAAFSRPPQLEAKSFGRKTTIEGVGQHSRHREKGQAQALPMSLVDPQAEVERGPSLCLLKP